MDKMAFAAKLESKSNLKHRAFFENMTDLADLIDEGGPMKLALRLFQEGLLKEDTYEETLLESKTGKYKAIKIVNELQKKLKVCPERYEKLIEVLNKEEMSVAVKKIKDKYKGKCIQQYYCMRFSDVYLHDSLGQHFSFIIRDIELMKKLATSSFSQSK